MHTKNTDTYTINLDFQDKTFLITPDPSQNTPVFLISHQNKIIYTLQILNKKPSTKLIKSCTKNILNQLFKK